MIIYLKTPRAGGMSNVWFSVAVQSQIPLYGHLIITDSYLCPWVKHTHIHPPLIWTPVNADNRHLFLAQLTHFHRKSKSQTQALLCQLTSFFIDLVFCSNKGCIFTYIRRVYYTFIGLQRSNIFYAEFKALPKPSIKYKMQLCRLSMNEKFMPKSRDPSTQKSVPL